MEQPLTDLSSWRADRCSLAKAIDLVGTRSAMLILREAYYGTTRFDGFASRVGITEAVAAKQLRRLTEAGLLTKQPYREAGQRTRHEYVLTDKGRDLLPALLALMQWGDKYLQPDGGPLEIVEDATGAPIRVQIRSEAGNEVGLEGLRVRVKPAARRSANRTRGNRTPGNRT